MTGLFLIRAIGHIHFQVTPAQICPDDDRK
jgi:hypothetical protein